MKRWDLINWYIAKYQYQTFLEIGHDKGELFDKVDIANKYSIDPNPKTHPTFIMSSDDFFEQYTDYYDIIFIDGLHEHAQVYRDIQNSLQHLNKNGVIIMHDCHPTSELCQRHSFSYPGGNWTGDCWKAFVKARAELPYELYVWDYDWGCGVIDTHIKRCSDVSMLPTVMAAMTYDDFLNHQQWMNYKYEFC